MELNEIHRRLGANMTPYRGALAVADYGDPESEGEALRSACGLIDRSWASGIEMLGEDRARFLSGYITCDVKELAPGDGAYGFITSVKGRVFADPVVLALDDRLMLELPPGQIEDVSQHLSKYVIVDRVEIRPLDDMVALSLIGPRSAEVLGTNAELLAEAALSHGAAEGLGPGVRLVREPAFEVGGGEIPAWTIWVPAGGAPALVETLLEGNAGGLVPVGHRAFDGLRVEAGRPLFGLDFGGDNFPQETGLEDRTVSYTKGCYLGQEVVARIHYRGGVNRHLRGLVFDDDAVDQANEVDPVGRAVLVAGREVGTVTSAATLGGGRRLGLAILHRKAEPGTDVEVTGSGVARVVELPFGPPIRR